MRVRPASLLACALLALAPAPAVGQGNPFGPIGPSVPPPAPEPERDPEPAQGAQDEDEISARDALILLGLGAALIGGAIFALTRETARAGRRRLRREQQRTRDDARRRLAGRGATALKAGARPSERRDQARPKAPPPPPRKRAAKSRRRSKRG